MGKELDLAFATNLRLRSVAEMHAVAPTNVQAPKPTYGWGQIVGSGHYEIYSSSPIYQINRFKLAIISNIPQQVRDPAC